MERGKAANRCAALKTQAYDRMNNVGPNRGMNGRVNGRRAVSMSMEFYEPVAANAAIFVALIAIDLYNKDNTLIPVHAVGGVIITLATLYLCRYNYLTAAWIFAILPGLFLLFTFLNAASKNQYVIDAGNAIEDAYEYTRDNVTYGVKKAYDTVDHVYDEAQEFVEDVNTYGVKKSSSISDAWMKAFGVAKTNGLEGGAAAIAATAAVGSAPPVGTESAAKAKEVMSSTNSTTVKGEYLYICGDGGKRLPFEKAAALCTRVSNECAKVAVADQDACKDKGASYYLTPAVCLGSLATGGAPPKDDARNECLRCDTDTMTGDELNFCRCTAMGTCPDLAAPVVAGFANYASAYYPA